MLPPRASETVHPPRVVRLREWTVRRLRFTVFGSALAMFTLVVLATVVVRRALWSDASSFWWTADDASRLGSPWTAPAFALRDQRNQLITNSTLSGHVWIASFLFTRCTSVCPMLTSRMRRLQQELSDPSLRFLSFSVDPEHDSVEVLREYASLWAPDETRWALLHSEREPLRELLDGMRLLSDVRPDAALPLLHTSVFFLIDGSGRVRALYDSNDERALQRLVRDAQRVAHES